MSLITETNQQYYQGSQGFRGDAGNTQNQTLITTFDTDLIMGSATSWNPTDADYSLNNFKVYTSPTGFAGTWSEITTFMSLENNTVDLETSLPGASAYIVVQLKVLTGGKYGSTDIDKAYGQTVENNYGEYAYVKLSDIINNYMVGYVGDGKIVQTAKKSDVLFWAKRSLQEFSYDTLKSIHSSELTIPESLSLTIPQDYVNYVRMSWIDQLGVKRIIYPTNNLTTNPYNTFLQDKTGQPTQDSHGENIEGTSITEERWGQANDRLINSSYALDTDFNYAMGANGFNGTFNWGRLYGLDAQYSQSNGWFGINEREGRFTFSSNLVGRLIVLEYISDGLAYDLDTKVPKMAEDAMYKSISYNLIANRAGQQEYVVQRFKKERSASLRNAKIRLSNIKLDEIVQVMRGKSKWIKH
tara:strand:+ start:1707 stop:2945 length:1239 start_codon:yes stop_codon:yes gene_type:complete